MHGIHEALGSIHRQVVSCSENYRQLRGPTRTDTRLASGCVEWHRPMSVIWLVSPSALLAIFRMTSDFVTFAVALLRLVYEMAIVHLFALQSKLSNAMKLLL